MAEFKFKNDRLNLTIFANVSGPTGGPWVSSYSVWKMDADNCYNLAIFQEMLPNFFHSIQGAKEAALTAARAQLDALQYRECKYQDQWREVLTLRDEVAMDATPAQASSKRRPTQEEFWNAARVAHGPNAATDALMNSPPVVQISFAENIDRDLRNSDVKSDMTDARAMKIVSAYGAIIETAPIPGITVADVSELPYAKEAIKEALMFLIRKAGNATLRQQLMAGYAFLADWQSGVGPIRLGFDPSKVDLTLGALPIAKQHKAAEAAAAKWLAMAEAERELLERELNAL